MDRQAATKLINDAWKDAATDAFNDVAAKFKGTDKVEEVYDAAVALTEERRVKYEEEEDAYEAHIAEAAYTEPAAKAKLDDATSDVAEQKDVFDTRELATAA